MQLTVLITMISGGIYIGFALETYRRLTRHIRNKVIVKYLLEISFWLAQTIILFYILFRVNHGELRLYMPLACLLGFSIYMVVFKRVYLSILEFIIKVIVAILHAVYVMVIQPIIWLVKMFFKIIKGILGLFYSVIKYLTHRSIAILNAIIPNKVSKKASQLYLICSTMIIRQLKELIKIIQKWR